jgi:hypothetical protein
VDLSDIFCDLERYEKYGCVYYKVVDFVRRLKAVNDLKIENDIILTPFYLTSDSTYE